MMPRLPRIEFENATYHVMARGNHRADIVFSDNDSRCFNQLLMKLVKKQVGKRLPRF